VATSADGKSQGKLCSSSIALNASKQIRPLTAASLGVPGRSTMLIDPSSPKFWRSMSVKLLPVMVPVRRPQYNAAT
jgi:hypothetical protein